MRTQYRHEPAVQIAYTKDIVVGRKEMTRTRTRKMFNIAEDTDMISMEKML